MAAGRRPFYMLRTLFYAAFVLGGVSLGLVVVGGCSARAVARIEHPVPRVARPPVSVVPSAKPPVRLADEVRDANDTMRVAGEDVSVGTRVVLFDEPGGYSAYRGASYFNARRDESRSARVPAPVPTRAVLNQLVDRVVLHYDVAGLSSRCFRTLQQDRGLSCHFLLDLDGTVYQTLDLKERAWHAGTSNSRSVGIEIANVGAYPKGEPNPFARWYRASPGGVTRLILPPDSGVRYPERAQTPARAAPVTGPIHGRQLVQYDLTDAQYHALIKLVSALCRTFPRMNPDAPRAGGDPSGVVLPGLMTAADRVGFGGIVGHHHLTGEKSDPGPAFDWTRLLSGVRAESAAR